MNPVSNARASSDTRHRMQVANSAPRSIKLIGLGRGGAAVIDGLDRALLHRVDVVAITGGLDPARLENAEMIFMVACPGDDVSAAQAIKAWARAAHVATTGILLDDGGLHAELPLLRAASDMLIVAADPGYVSDMLVQLGA
jgi:hypothetical protein